MQENSRNILVKRKIPDTFYAPPVLKTQVFSNEQLSHINQTHMNSLPLQEKITYTNLCEGIQSKFVNNFEFPEKQQAVNRNDQVLSCSPIHTTMNENKKLIPSVANNFMMNHCKTYSLPVSFEEQYQHHMLNDSALNYNARNSQIWHPPTRNENYVKGDIKI